MTSMTKSAVSLEKLQAEAPGLVSLAKKAAISLEKRGLSGERAAVYLVLDHSGSMDPHYRSGAVQKLADQTLALSVNLDNDGIVPVVFFSNRPSAPFDVNLSNYAGRVQQEHLGESWGGTRYAPAMQAVIDHYLASGTADPALVVFQTDGDPQDVADTESVLKVASKLPIFWSFVGYGQKLMFLRKLSNLRVGIGGRKVDNASRFETGDYPLAVTDEALYDGITHEYPGWLTAVRSKGILR